MMEIRQLTIPDALLCALEKQARYLNYTRPNTIYYCVEVGYQHVLAGVFGNGDWGQYEWFVWDEDAATLRTSDCGYGSGGGALCSGLVEAGAERPNGDHDLFLGWIDRRESAKT